ncbi:BolA family transcriptional regulator [Xenophilus arseniciresistens]|uniref:BolA family transcriptional regulator n=1 Tax=Xenophilus arseniciresistens TaxID=1283306 RepID=A0AAE3T249_9BURK|nr:BolA family protein [Xenophilus arseniciresistens]MDA7418042.1 BolA family transcriptional regulator [Xenophilus arseniciresistens]
MSSLPTTAELEATLRAALAPTQLEVIDESGLHAGHAGASAEGFGTHFRVRIASPRFEGCSRVARHRLVYDALQSFVPRGLHAIAIETL